MAHTHVSHGVVPTISAVSPFTELSISFSSTNDNIVIPGTANQTIRVFRLFFVSDASTTVTFKNGATSLTGAITLFAGGAFVLDYQDLAWFITTAGNDFIISQSGTAQISGRIYYQKT